MRRLIKNFHLHGACGDAEVHSMHHLETLMLVLYTAVKKARMRALKCSMTQLALFLCSMPFQEAVAWLQTNLFRSWVKLLRVDTLDSARKRNGGMPQPDPNMWYSPSLNPTLDNPRS